MERPRSLYDYIMHDLKVEQLNECINNLTGIEILLIIMLIIFLVSLIIPGLSLKKLVDMSAYMQALEKLIKADYRDMKKKTRNLRENQVHHCSIRLERNSLRF